MASEGKNPGEDTAKPAPSADAYPRLRHIEITNYKALDHLALDIPAPRMPGDPDIFIVGSKNGLGKTSLLECCALAHLTHRDHDAVINGFGPTNGIGEDIELARDPKAGVGISYRYSGGGRQPVALPRSLRLDNRASLARQIFARSANILIHPDLLFFHGHRKITEGPIRTQEMLSDGPSDNASAVKLKAVRLLLASSGLVEGTEVGDAEHRLEQLNKLLETFAGGRLDKKLRPVSQDRLDVRVVTPRNTTFSFDALSSGQKEIVTTLFLIWNETLAHPALVLIDEPELHLNAEWQREFLRHLLSLAPNNQYILATHSEDIFASVDEERRVLLEASHG